MARLSALACVAATALATGCGAHARAYGDGDRLARVEAWSDEDRPAENNAIPMIWAFAFPPVLQGRVEADQFTAITVGNEPWPREALRGRIEWSAKTGQLTIALQRRVGDRWTPLSVAGTYHVDPLLPMTAAPAMPAREGH